MKIIKIEEERDFEAVVGVVVDVERSVVVADQEFPSNHFLEGVNCEDDKVWNWKNYLWCVLIFGINSMFTSRESYLGNGIKLLILKFPCLLRFKFHGSHTHIRN